MKLLKILFFILITNWSFGQASDSGDFFISIEFEKNIPVEKIEVNYYHINNNHIEKINFVTDSFKNTIEIFGYHSYVVGVDFPVIVFSYKEKIINDFNSLKNQEKQKEKIEIQNLYYLIIKDDSFNRSNENFDSSIIFSNEKPNIIIRYERDKGIIKYNVSNETDFILPFIEMPISNKLIRVKNN